MIGKDEATQPDCRHPDVVEFESQRWRCNMCRTEVDRQPALSVYDQLEAAEIRAEFAERRLAAYERLDTAARAWAGAEESYGDAEDEIPSRTEALLDAIDALGEVTP